MKLLNAVYIMLIFFWVMHTPCCLSEPNLVRPGNIDDNIKPTGYSLSDKIVQEFSSALKSTEVTISSEAGKDLTRRCKEHLKTTNPDKQLLEEINTQLWLIGRHKVDDGYELLVDNLDYQYVNYQGTKYYPARDALIIYGEDAIPHIIQSFEDGVTGRKAALLARALGSIKNAKYRFKEYREFLRELKKTMSEEAYNTLIKYPAD